MKQSVDSTGRVTLTINEIELHTFVATIRQCVSRELGIDDEHFLERVVIAPEGTGEVRQYFTDEFIKNWEYRMNKLILETSRIDADYHTDTDYTCC